MITKGPVSYTHLTLPTILRGERKKGVGSANIKENKMRIDDRIDKRMVQ